MGKIRCNFLCKFEVILIFAADFADMVKLVDTPDLGSGAARCVGSSPIIRTKRIPFDRSQRDFLIFKNTFFRSEFIFNHNDMADQAVKLKIKTLEKDQVRLETALEKLAALSDEQLRQAGLDEMRLDFVRTWKFHPFRAGKPTKPGITNFHLRKGYKACADYLEKEISGIERSISNLKFKIKSS